MLKLFKATKIGSILNQHEQHKESPMANYQLIRGLRHQESRALPPSSFHRTKPLAENREVEASQIIECGKQRSSTIRDKPTENLDPVIRQEVTEMPGDCFYWSMRQQLHQIGDLLEISEQFTVVLEEKVLFRIRLTAQSQRLGLSRIGSLDGWGILECNRGETS